MANIDGYHTIGKSPARSVKLDGDYSYNIYGDYEEISCKPAATKTTCYVIVTCTSITWSLLTIITTIVIITAVITPQWLVGRPRLTGMRTMNGTPVEPLGSSYSPTIGIFNRCTKVHQSDVTKSDSCDTYITGFSMTSDEFPDTWKSSLILFTVAVILLIFTNFTAVFSLCIQSIFKKSIFTVSGLFQSLAALLMVVGQVLYPVGWSSRRVKELCGRNAGAFLIDDCHIGWSYYVCMGGTALLFVCALLSIKAETSTSSDKIEKKIIEGKNVICTI